MQSAHMATESDVVFGLLGLAALAAIVCGILYAAGAFGKAPAPAVTAVTSVTTDVTGPQPALPSCELAAGGFCPSGLTCDRGGTPNAACVPDQARRRAGAAVPESPSEPDKRKEVLSYSCAGCPALGGGPHQCCRHCYEMQALAAKRAPPFDSQAYRAQEVRCPQCEEIMKTKPEYCTVASDGRFRCSNGANCNVEPTRTYEE